MRVFPLQILHAAGCCWHNIKIKYAYTKQHLGLSLETHIFEYKGTVTMLVEDNAVFECKLYKGINLPKPMLMLVSC